MTLKRQTRQKKNLKLLTSFAAAFLLIALSVPAQSEDKTNIGENTGLPIPRFAALKSNNINARSGPGDNYPIKAIYKRAGLPVEIVSEFKLWREIVDIEGEHNWVHKAMLTGNRHAIVKEEMYSYESPNGGNATAKLEKNSQVRIKECGPTTCLMQIENGLQDIKGWVDKSKLWGVYQHEVFD